MEIFKDIPDYEGVYQISNTGIVKGLERRIDYNNGGFRIQKEKLLSICVGSNGYPQVTLYKEGESKTKSIHQLLAIVFLNHVPKGFNGLMVDHINNIKTDNRLENLQLVTARENSSKDRRRGVSKYVGVHWFKPENKWISSISIKGKRKHLGLFANEYDAHLRYQLELTRLK